MKKHVRMWKDIGSLKGDINVIYGHIRYHLGTNRVDLGRAEHLIHRAVISNN